MDTATLKNMSKAERLQAMEALWDSFLYEDGEIDTPKWHKEIIDERNMAFNKCLQKDFPTLSIIKLLKT